VPAYHFAPASDVGPGDGGSSKGGGPWPAELVFMEGRGISAGVIRFTIPLACRQTPASFLLVSHQAVR
jgi:hypothetical protein